MEVNYIFLLKQNTQLPTSICKHITLMLSDLFYDITDNTIVYLDSSGFKHTLPYKISQEDATAYLKITSNAPPTKSAHILDCISTSIISNEKRKCFQIIKTYDEASLSFCTRLMTPFGIYERRLREVIYLTIVKVYGLRWFEKTFDNNLKKVISSRTSCNPTKHIENALEELTYEDMKVYLFTKTRAMPLEQIIDYSLSSDKLSEMTKDEIVKIIESLRPMSLWDNFFSENKNLSKMYEEISDLQPYRNKVMHHKNISEKEFVFTKRKLSKLNRKINKAIEILENRIYNKYDFNNITHSLDILSISLAKCMPTICTTVLTSLNDSIKELLEPINLLALEQIKTICEPLNLISKEANLSSISNLSLITPSIDDPISEMKKNASDFNSQIN